MTSEGRAYGRFRRTLERGSLTQVLAAASDLPQISLDDALAIVLRCQGTPKAERAAVRWLARLALEAPTVSLADLRQASDALENLPSPDAHERIARLCDLHGLPRAGAVARNTRSEAPLRE